MQKITIYGAGVDATYEEVGAIELLKGAGVEVEVILAENTNEAQLHAARLTLSALEVNAVVYRPGALEKSDALVSFGRVGVFSTIRKYSDRPKKLVYGLSCLESNKEEIKSNSEGLIDEIFVGSKSRSIEAVKSFVKKSNRGVEFRAGYLPFCNPTSSFFNLEFQKKGRSECFYFMRNTRDAPGFSFSDHWLMVAKVTCPQPRTKRFLALNWGKNLSKIAGNPGVSSDMWNGLIDVTLEAPQVPWEFEKDAYYKSSALVHFYPEQEPFSFSAAKAILTGVVVVAAPAPAFLDFIDHGVSGFLARTPDEVAYFTSRLAWEPFLRMKIANDAYTRFVNDGPGNADRCLPWWKGLIDG